MTTHLPSRRKKLIVNPTVQKRIIVSVTLLPTLALAATTLILGLFCRRLMAETEGAEAFLPSLVPLFIAVLGFVVASGAIVVWCALRFSNQIAGPSHRLVEAAKRVQRGDLTRVSLRAGDHLTEVADAFNDVLDWIERKLPPEARAPDETGEAGAAEPRTAAREPEPELEPMPR